MGMVGTMETSSCHHSVDVVILGAGYAGLMAALRLARRKWGLRIALVSDYDQLLERVRLQESIVAEVPPRVPSISAFVAGTAIEFIRGHVTSLAADQRRIRVATDKQQREVAFDQAIYALGSSIDVDGVRGAAAHAYRLEPGDGPRSAAALRSRLRQTADRPVRVATVGGAETGIEVAGEIKTAWPHAEVTLVTRSRCGDFRGARVEEAVRAELKRLGVRLIDDEVIAEVRANEVVTASGRSIACDICAWSGGLRAAPIAKAAGLATDSQGRIWVDPNLRSISHPHIFAVGDAARPIAPSGAPYRLSAFVALVSGAYAADAIVAQRAKRRLQPFSFSTFGQGVAIGQGGVGFFSYPDDRQRLFILKGRTARRIRNFFVWLVTYVLKIERRAPGFFLAGTAASVMAPGKRGGTKAANRSKGPDGMMLDHAFAELRPAMFALAYRITGNRADAEEIVQDAFIRLHDTAPTDAVRSLKAYLATITARLSLNRLRDQRARRETYIGEWLPEPLLTEDQPGVRAEDVSFALLAVLERLSPLERVVFVLRNAFDFTFEEIMPVVGRDAVTCRKIFSRARARILEERPRFTVDRERHRALLRSFTEAARGGDMAKLVSLFDNDVVLHGDGGGKAVATKEPVVGNVAVARFIIAVTRTLPLDVDAAEIDLNGAPALMLTADRRPVVAILIDTDGARIHSVFAVANPDKLEAIA